MLLYYITDRRAFPGDETTRRRRLLEKMAEAARAGVDYIQLRERDLPAGDLETLAQAAVHLLRKARLEARNAGPATKVLVNSRTDVALSAGADGVHLRGDDVSPRQVAAICSSANHPNFLTAVSCHSVEEIRHARDAGAHFAVLAPVFGKEASTSTRVLGLEFLANACQISLPIFALGGVTFENASACKDAGAAGIAAIRLFQNNNVADVVAKLRRL